ncbi:MAG: hypothetical protein WC548_01925 [Candidatus Pacearchaeota archaeon]
MGFANDWLFASIGDIQASQLIVQAVLHPFYGCPNVLVREKN